MKITGKPSNARRRAKAGSMSAHPLRRRPSIKAAPAQRLAFARKRSPSKSGQQARRLRRRARIKPTIDQCHALAGCRGCPTPTHYDGPLSCQRWTDILHQLSNTYLQSTTPANADAQQVPLRCRASVAGAEPTSKQRRLSVNVCGVKLSHILHNLITNIHVMRKIQ